MIPAAETVRTAARLAVTRIANTSVSDTEPLLSSGLLDSLSLPRLIGEIEQRVRDATSKCPPKRYCSAGSAPALPSGDGFSALRKT